MNSLDERLYQVPAHHYLCEIRDSERLFLVFASLPNLLRGPFLVCHHRSSHHPSLHHISPLLRSLSLSKLNLRHQTRNLPALLRQRINQHHKFPLRHPLRDLHALLHLDILLLLHGTLLVDVVVALEESTEVLVALEQGDLAAVVEAELDGDEGVGALGDIGCGGAGGGDEEVGAAIDGGLVRGTVGVVQGGGKGEKERTEMGR